jgi:hypothetical protein
MIEEIKKDKKHDELGENFYFRNLKERKIEQKYSPNGNGNGNKNN